MIESLRLNRDSALQRTRFREAGVWMVKIAWSFCIQGNKMWLFFLLKTNKIKQTRPTELPSIFSSSWCLKQRTRFHTCHAQTATCPWGSGQRSWHNNEHFQLQDLSYLHAPTQHHLRWGEQVGEEKSRSPTTGGDQRFPCMEGRLSAFPWGCPHFLFFPGPSFMTMEDDNKCASRLLVWAIHRKK